MAYSKREVALVVVVAVLACMGVAQATISCGTVSSKLAPCLTYLEGAVAGPSTGCCGGVNYLYTATKPSRPDRVTACGCIKTLAGELGSKLNAGNVGALPGKCGVNLGYKPSINIDCNSIP